MFALVMFRKFSFHSVCIQINKETGRMTLSLKQSMCSSTDASFIQEYFILEEKVMFVIRYVGNKAYTSKDFAK